MDVITAAAALASAARRWAPCPAVRAGL